MNNYIIEINELKKQIADKVMNLTTKQAKDLFVSDLSSQWQKKYSQILDEEFMALLPETLKEFNEANKSDYTFFLFSLDEFYSKRCTSIYCESRIRNTVFLSFTRYLNKITFREFRIAENPIPLHCRNVSK